MQPARCTHPTGCIRCTRTGDNAPHTPQLAFCRHKIYLTWKEARSFARVFPSATLHVLFVLAVCLYAMRVRGAHSTAADTKCKKTTTNNRRDDDVARIHLHFAVRPTLMSFAYGKVNCICAAGVHSHVIIWGVAVVGKS